MLSRRILLSAGGAATLIAGSNFAAASADVNSTSVVGLRRVSVEMFGAVADGEADCTEAIRQALAHIQRVGGGVIEFSGGTYRFSSIQSDVDNLLVDGRGSTLLSTLPKNSDISALWLRGDHLAVMNLTIDYVVPVVTHPPQDLLNRGKNGYGLRIGGRRDPKNFIAREILVQNVTVRNARNGGISVYKSRIAKVLDCTVLVTLGNGIGFDGCLDTIVAANNIVEDTGDDMLVVVTDKSVPGGTRSAIFSGNIVRRGFAKGIASTGVDRLIVDSNVVEDTFAGGIAAINDTYYGLGGSYNVVVSNNIVTRAGWRFGPGTYHKDPCEVGYSVHISSGTETVRVVDNLMDNGYSHGVCATACPFLTISGNTIRSHRGIPVVVGDVRAKSGDRLANFVIESNQIEAQALPAIVAGGGKVGRIEGNVISSASVGLGSNESAAIQTGAMSGVRVNGNVVGG